jgi:cytochrome c1
MTSRRGAHVVVAVATLAPLAFGCGGGRAPGFAVATGGDGARGRVLIVERSCGACHEIPGVPGARGVVAPPLTRFAARSFIAGVVPNTPANLVAWVRDPRSISPNTAMPALGLDEQQARDVAAYLYALR